jgi:hypothetical protein
MNKAEKMSVKARIANPRQPLDLQANNLVVLINKQTDKVNQRAS